MKSPIKKVSLVVSKPYQSNEIFDLSSSLNRDNCLYMFFILKKEFEKRGICLATNDINLTGSSDYVIHLEIPNQLFPDHDQYNSYAIIFESEIISKNNWDQSKHEAFKKIFTWSPELVDGIKYVKINFGHKITENFSIDYTKKRKLCCLIAGNKFSSHKNQLYDERIKAIRWFENNQPNKFDLFGIGWESEIFTMPLIRKFNRVKKLRKIFKPSFPSYKGPIKNKIPVLADYKFTICYENGHGIKGYITEKIFDCFFAGTIPVYLGAPDILDYIPANTFIDKNKFKTYDALYKYLSSMSEEEYISYLNEIEKFVRSRDIDQFNAENIAKTIVKEVLKT